MRLIEAELVPGASSPRQRVPATHRRWLLINAVGVAAVGNLLVNGAIAGLVTRGQHDIRLWRSPIAGTSLIDDSLLTLFLLPLASCFLVTSAVWREQRQGALSQLVPAAAFGPWLAGLPRSLVLRSLAFGAPALVLFAPFVMAGLLIDGVQRVSVSTFILYKVLFAITLGTIVTPVAALCAMTDAVADS